MCTPTRHNSCHGWWRYIKPELTFGCERQLTLASYFQLPGPQLHHQPRHHSTKHPKSGNRHRDHPRLELNPPPLTSELQCKHSSTNSATAHAFKSTRQKSRSPCPEAWPITKHRKETTTLPVRDPNSGITIHDILKAPINHMSGFYNYLSTNRQRTPHAY